MGLHLFQKNRGYRQPFGVARIIIFFVPVIEHRRNSVKLIHLTLLATLFASNVQASSPEEWLEHDKLVRKTCLAKSDLKNKKVLSSPILFSDDMGGYTALVIGGGYPQKHMQGQESRELCLFERGTGKAEISVADSLMPTK